MEELVLFVISVPTRHADAVRAAIAKAGGGQQGAYSHCSFSYRGTGRFQPEKGAHPSVGEVGKLEAVEEERIEVLCERSIIPAVIEAVKQAHPYEVPAYHYITVERLL